MHIYILNSFIATFPRDGDTHVILGMEYLLGKLLKASGYEKKFQSLGKFEI